MLRLRGKAELPFVREFFYSEPIVPSFGFRAQHAVISFLKRSEQPLREAILSDARARSLTPGQMAFLYGRFPGIKRGLLLDWLFAQQEDLRQMGNSIEHFLTIMLLRNRDHGFAKAILLDPRLENAPVPMLRDIQQKLHHYRIPRDLYDRFPGALEALRDSELQAEALKQLVQFLRAAAEYVSPRYIR